MSDVERIIEELRPLTEKLGMTPLSSPPDLNAKALQRKENAT